LADGRRGLVGRIMSVRAEDAAEGGLAGRELERRLLEMGFVEGARVEILHEGFIGRDPICVRVEDMRVAVRRNDVRGVRISSERSR
jgi:ferrous iron transport protein A